MGQKQDKAQRAQKRAQMLELQRRANKRKKVLLIVLAAVVVICVAIAAFIIIKPKFGGNENASSGSSPSASASPSNSGSVPDKTIAQNKTWNGTIETTVGNMKVELFGDKAPQAVSAFIKLSQDNWWSQNNASCPRLTNSANFALLQCGAPNGDQAGGPGFSFGPIENAPKDNKYATGTLAMARQGGKGDSMGSQFFIVYKDTDIPADAAGGYTIFGKVTEGLDKVTDLAAKGIEGGSSDGKPKEAVRITKVSID
jgi:peptidyl-prolyl cis-trans isomerase B (cyclophilin B)